MVAKRTEAQKAASRRNLEKARKARYKGRRSAIDSAIGDWVSNPSKAKVNKVTKALTRKRKK